MNWPTSQDYNEAIQNAATSTSDPDLKGGQPIVNALGLPVPRSGNFADVYQFQGGDGRMWAVKCFTRPVVGLQERYAEIDEYLIVANLPFTVGFQYLREGIRIRGKWFPLLKMEWVEGFTLNEFVRLNADKPTYLHKLMLIWAKLTARLRDANIAHADLQHGNVLLVAGNASAKLSVKLIDYDGMWIPPLKDKHSGEVGHPNFQHPFRLKEKLFNAEVDRFPHLVIACALRATLVGGKALWDEYDNGDNLLFRERDLRDPSSAPIFKALWQLNDPVLRTLVGHIVLCANQPLRMTPWLDRILLVEGRPSLSAEQEKAAIALLGIEVPKANSARAVAAPRIEEKFNEFDLFDDDTGEQQALSDGFHSAKNSRKAAVGRNSTTPWLIGGAVLALAIVVGIIATMSGGKKETPIEVAQNESHEDIHKKPIHSGKKEAPKIATLPKKEPAKKWEAEDPVPPVEAPFPSAGFTALFNGKDLIGWKAEGNIEDATWTIAKDRDLVGEAAPGRPVGLLLTDRADYRNFRLRAEAMLNEGMTSAVLVRCGPAEGGRGGFKSYGVHLAGSNDRGETGDLFSHVYQMANAPIINASREYLRPGKWFPLEIVADGKQIRVSVNDKTVVDFTDEWGTYQVGRIGLLCRGSSAVHFRKIEIRELPATEPEPPDPIREKLAEAKAIYIAEMEKCHKGIGEHFDKLEEGATGDGSRAKLDQIKADRKDFEERGTLPKTVPFIIKQKFPVLRVALEAAYDLAAKEYRQANLFAKVRPIERELADYKAGRYEPRSKSRE